MTKQERIAAARARADTAAAALAAFDKAVADNATAGRTFVAKLERARKASLVVVANLANSLTIKPLVDLSLDLGYGKADRPKTRKAVAAAVEGGAKISTGQYQSYSLKGLVPRLRVLSRDQQRTIQKAEARLRRADRAAQDARAALERAKREMFEAGVKVTPDNVIDAITKRESIRVTPAKLPAGVIDTSAWQRDRLVHEAEQAAMHLLATRKGDECPCAKCGTERLDAERARAEADRRAALPKIAVGCSKHGRKRAPWERKARFVNAEEAAAWGYPSGGQWRQVPIAYCPGGEMLVLVKQIALDLKTEAKAAKAAKAAASKDAATLARRKAAGARLPEPEEGDEIAFVCPSCNTIVDFAEVLDYSDEGDDPQLVVGCYSCGSEASVSGVARLSPPAQEKEATAA